ncbi:MAG: alpha/beta fold hydrolase [Polyangiaceae bacterium]
MQMRRYWPKAGDWTLDVRRYQEPDRVDRTLRPILLIPGYCMNTTPLTFHPSGPSLIEFLTERGFEVWTANLRGQGDSHSKRNANSSGFRDLALVDLPTALSQVRAATESERDRVDLIGCSLGGTYIYAYLAHHPQTPDVGSVVGMGAPLRWPEPHALLRTLFASPAFASRLRVSGTRRMAALALPLARRFPKMLSMYMNTEIVDLSGLDTLLATVEDPIAKLNGEIARWVQSQELVVSGVKVREALRGVRRPYLCIAANRDGIVPLQSAQSAVDAFADSEALVVGDDETWFAHADLFVSRPAQERVFTPLARWLKSRA